MAYLDVKTRFPFPPLDIYQHFPESIPWDVQISDLSSFWLDVQCSCTGATGDYVFDKP